MSSFYISIICISLLFIYQSYNKNLHFAQNPSAIEKDTKALNKKIAKYIAQLKADETWVAFFEEHYTKIPNCEAYYQYTYFPKKSSDIIFWKSNTYMYVNYPNMTIKQIATEVISKINKNSLFITFNDTTSIDSVLILDWNNARILSKIVSEYMQTNAQWKKVEVYKSIQFSNLAIYVKR